MRHKSKSRRGVTLIELVVALAVMGIIMAGIASIFTFGLKLQSQASDMYASKAITSTVLARVQNELRFASNVTVNTSVPATFVSGTKYLYAKSGVFTVQNGTVAQYTLPATGSNLGGYYCTVAFTPTSAQSIGVTVTVTKGSAGATLYATQTSVLLNNNTSGIYTGSGAVAVSGTSYAAVFYTAGS
jgi:prepilin-type N-terminal cleavage/methylation domain-containing protein